MREAKRLRSRRIRALLAGGLVFGVGAAMTLAAWNDSEYATATFTAGKFDIVGSTDGSNFSNHNPSGSPSTSAATLSFSVPVAAMAPGNTTYALFSVKTTNPSVAGTVLLTSSSTAGTGLGTYLKYGVKTITGTTCTAATYAASTSVVIADGTALTTGAAASQVVAANGGAQVNYCFAVTLPSATPNAAQGLTAIQTWQLQGTSS
jgi:predicted ribosomally synthesized peptide with SipW-like signal peptide